MDSITERLRSGAADYIGIGDTPNPVWIEAADELDRLRRELAEAREALELTHGALADIGRLQWLIVHGERVFGSLWRDASMKDIDAAISNNNNNNNKD